MAMFLEAADYRRHIWPHRNLRNDAGGKLSIGRNNPRTVWYRRKDGKGICAIHLQGSLYRLKGILTMPEWRGRGVGTEMTLELLSMCQADPQCKVIEAISVNPDFYLPHGFILVGYTGNGSGRVRLTKQGKADGE